MNRLKIAVYTIALNEEKFVERWFNSCRDADYILIADTGSTDRTVEIAKKLGITVVNINVVPFRFDDARNASLSLLPSDIDFCIALDLDEVLTNGWYEELQKTRPEVTRVEYRDVRRWKGDGTPDVTHIASKIHRRSGFRWINAVHEMITQYVGESIKEKSNLEVHHLPDYSKSRSSYLPLLEVAHKENPSSDQLHFWLAREYLIHNKNDESIKTFFDYLDRFPDAWAPERAFAYLFLAKLQTDNALDHLFKAAETTPNFRDPWLDIADYYRFAEDWTKCLEAAKKAEEITFMPEVYLLDKSNWFGPRCFDLIALSSHFLKDNVTAVEYGKKALDLAPNDNRLRSNLSVYRRTLESDTSLLESSKSVRNVENDLEKMDSANVPSVLWAVLAKDASRNLPLYLECLLSQDYPKESIALYVRTNDNNDDTEAILKAFIDEHGSMFREIFFDTTSIDESIKVFSPHEWNSKRFQILGKIRQASVDYARLKSYDYYFCADTDNFLLPHTLFNLVSLNLPIVAPMLRMVVSEKSASNGESRDYSNFYFTDEHLFFRGCAEYYSILNRETPGVHSVPLIHCTYLIKSELFPKIDYCFRDGDWEYKNLVYKLREEGVDLFLDNRVEYGNLTLSSAIEDARFQLKGLTLENIKSEADSALINSFNQIYALNKWGFRSGPGSDPEFAEPFIIKVNDYLERDDIESILDIGCGDFRLGQNYRLEKKEYTGLDVSSLIIEENRKFETASIKFIQGDFESWECERTWDLIIIKDVLQHLPNSSVIKILNKIESHCKIALICNDLSESNIDIVPGGYRRINLNVAPFNRNYNIIMDFQGKRVIEFKST